MQRSLRPVIRPDLRPGRWLGAIAVALGLVALLVSGPSRPVTGADPYVAGGDLTRVSAIQGTQAAAVAVRAAGHERALSLATPAHRTMQLVADRREGRAYVEVTDLDGRGRPLAVLRYGTNGRLTAAVRLGWSPGGGRALGTESEAAGAGLRLARSVGAEPTGTVRATRRTGGGWTVAWPRVVGGVPVPGDGLRVQLWADGSFHALASSERTLATWPSAMRERAEAEAIVGGWLDRWFPGRSRAGARIVDAALAWVAPNDTFDAARPDAPGDVLRLAWVVRVRSVGPLAESLRGLEVAVDAGDGSLLGGDVLR
jgi:hypothetical protein